MGTGELAKDLLRAQMQFQAWRSQRQRGSRVPRSLWALAVRLAQRHGVSRVATALRVDYYRLRREAGPTPAVPTPSGKSAFVELSSPTMLGKQCLFELDNGAGASLRLQLLGYDAADVAAVARTLWSAP
jgi:hypothetical protein